MAWIELKYCQHKRISIAHSEYNVQGHCKDLKALGGNESEA